MAMTQTPSGLSYEDTVVGTGASPQKGQKCRMHYTGWLWVNNAKDKKFDSSVDRGEPFEFPLGVGRVIKGWDQGLIGMHIKGKRTLIIPASLAYGEQPRPNIQPNSNLMFDVELINIVPRGDEGQTGAASTTISKPADSIAFNTIFIASSFDLMFGAKPPSSPTLVDRFLSLSTFFKW